MDTLADGAPGDRAGVLKLREPPGPVGALKFEGPRGGDLAGVRRTGERSLGVDLAESRSRSRYASCAVATS